MRAEVHLVVPHELLSGERIEVRGDDYRHLFKARRLEMGARVRVVDGLGLARYARVASVSRASAWLELGEPAPGREAQVVLELAVATLRPERAGLLVEKCTELGAAGVLWFNSSRAPRVYGTRQLARLERVARAAVEQCGRARIPYQRVLGGWERLIEYVGGESSSRTVILLQPCSESSLRASDLPRDGRDALLIVGPEGGFSDREATELAGLGASRRSLGLRVLRAETAAMVATGLLMSDDW